MSIRLYKVLGYGLSDAKSSQDDLNDPRINSDSALFSESPELMLLDYCNFLKERIDSEDRQSSSHNRSTHVQNVLELRQLMQKTEQELARESLLNSFHYQTPDYGMEGAFVVSPQSVNDWSRHGDLIDEVEFQQAQFSEGRLQVLRRGIEPYSGLYMDIRTGETLSFGIMDWVQLKNNYEENSNPELLPILDVLADSHGFDGHNDALAHIAPLIPQPVKNMCEFTGIFTDVKTLYQLRPMLYQYWR